MRAITHKEIVFENIKRNHLFWFCPLDSTDWIACRVIGKNESTHEIELIDLREKKTFVHTVPQLLNEYSESISARLYWCSRADARQYVLH